MKTNVKAWDLKTKLFDLINEFKDLAATCGAGDNEIEAHGQIDATACQLAEIYQGLPPVFTDAAKDDQHQEF